MLSFAYFLLKVTVCSGLLLSYYFFVLRNKRFHHYNRFYLLSAVALSFIIPAIKIEFWNEAAQQQQPAFTLLNAVATSDAYVEETLNGAAGFWDFNTVILAIFTLVSAAFFVWLIAGIVRIARIIYRNPKENWQNVHFVFTNLKETPFSFFRYIFWNRHIDLQTPEGKHILQHELTHVHEKHTADKLFMQLVLVAGWLNPFFWLIRKELNMIHEFIADKKAICDGDATAFAAMLLKASYPEHKAILTNSFFHSPIKRRLFMLTTSKRSSYSYLRRLMILPVLCFAIVFFAFKSKDVKPNHAAKQLEETYTVLIDAGHGGKDDGAMSTGGLKEKDITLTLAKLVKELNTNKNVKIVLSRGEDDYLSPPQRVQLAEKTQPQLFISLHVNNSAATGNQTMDEGAEIILPKDNMKFAGQNKLLSSFLAENFGIVFGQKVQIKQMQTKVWVLEANNICPSALVECGTFAKAGDVALLTAEDKQKEIAQAVLKSIESYFSFKEKGEAQN